MLPIVRYWIPHIRIISPEGLQGEMEAKLLGNLASTATKCLADAAQSLANQTRGAK